MDTEQIYSVVNSLVSQSMGSSSIAVTNTEGLVTVGQTILSSSTLTQDFINNLVLRIGKVIISYRSYNSKFSDLVLTDFEWGKILQKLKVAMPTNESDLSYDLSNGDSVDMYTVAKPSVTQKFYVQRNPYQIHITIQRVRLREAFQSASNMNDFIGAVFGEVQNKIELNNEILARTCLCNMIAEVSEYDSTTTNTSYYIGNSRSINLLYQYNTAKGTTYTVEQVEYSDDFLRYCIGVINQYTDFLEGMTTLYNDGTVTRHTPKDYQRLYVLTKWQRRFETEMLYGAYNDGYLKLKGYNVVPWLQSPNNPESIRVTRSSDSNTVTRNNIMAVLFDKDALGCFKKTVETSTTPENSAGLYYNTYWHFENNYLNDLSENFIYFYLSDAYLDL